MAPSGLYAGLCHAFLVSLFFPQSNEFSGTILDGSSPNFEGLVAM